MTVYLFSKICSSALRSPMVDKDYKLYYILHYCVLASLRFRSMSFKNWQKNYRVKKPLPHCPFKYLLFAYTLSTLIVFLSLDIPMKSRMSSLEKERSLSEPSSLNLIRCFIKGMILLLPYLHSIQSTYIIEIFVIFTTEFVRNYQFFRKLYNCKK